MNEIKNVTRPGAPLIYLFMGERMIIHLPCERTDNQLSLVEAILPPGSDCGLHVHQREDEAMYLITGELEATIGSLQVRMLEGECYFVPRNVPHRLRNTGLTTARILLINTPGTFSSLVGRAGSLLSGAHLSPPTPEQLRELLHLGEQFGMRMLVPPFEQGTAEYDGKPPIYKRPVYNPLPDSYLFFGVQMTIHLSGVETGNEFSLVESFIPANCDSGLHVHANEDECIYLLSGELELNIGDGLQVLKAGSCHFVPRNTPHRLRNKKAAAVQVIQVNTPGTLDPFFKGAGSLVIKGQQANAYPSPEQIGPILQLAEEYDFHMLIPPGV